jgi:hypothetical protein
MMSKLAVHSRAELVARAFRAGLVSELSPDARDTLARRPY